MANHHFYRLIRPIIFSSRKMVLYTVSKPPSVVNPKWIFWSKHNLGQSITPEQVSSLVFITRNKEICVLYKPTPVFNDRNELTAIIGNMFNESSSPAFFKIEKDEIGSCDAIRDFNLIPAAFRPKIALQSDLVKDTDWEHVDMEIALIAIPTLALLPYGKEIKSSILDDDFIEEMQGILSNHGFWVQTMNNVIDQFETDNHTETVLKRLISSVPPSNSCDPACAATKGIRNMTFASNPFADVSLLGKNSFEADQEKMKEFYHRNPTPACVEENDDDENIKKVHIPMYGTRTNQPPSLLVPSAVANPPPGILRAAD
jgi:hypothetical protein